MVYLKYYAKEQSDYKKEHNHILTQSETRKLMDECCMHYEIPSPRVLFSRIKKWFGIYREKSRTIEFSTHWEQGTALLTVAHELGHHFDSMLNGSYRKWDRIYGKRIYRKAHTKKHNECMKMVLRFFYRGSETSKYKNAPKLIILTEDMAEVCILGVKEYENSRKKKSIKKYKSLTELFAK